MSDVTVLSAANKVTFAITASSMIVVMLLSYVALPAYVVPEFSMLFDAFDPKLPLFTSFVLKYKYYLPVPIAASLFHLNKYTLAGIAAPLFRKKFWKLTFINMAVLALVYIVVIIAMYLPVFAMGGVV